MMRGSRQKKFNEFIRQLYVLQNGESLRQTIATGILDLLDGDNAFVNELVALKPLTCRSHIASRPFASSDFPTQFVERAHEIPLEDLGLDPNHVGAKVLTSVISPTRLRRTAYYNEVLRPEGVVDALGVELGRPRTVLTGIAIMRSSPGCSERDSRTFAGLLPHLEQAVNNAHEFSLLASASSFLAGAETGLGAGLILLDEEARLVHWSEATQKLIRRYFPTSEKSVNRLPEPLRKWITRQIRARRNGLSHTPLRQMFQGHALEFTLSEEPESPRFLLVVREKKIPVNLAALGLTPRETAVLHWIAEGKTNDEIAVILDVSFFTVKNQVKSIFRRLGVETRTAAAAMLLRKPDDII